MKKKIIAIALILILSCGSCYEAYAMDPVTAIEVAGGAIGTGGLAIGAGAALPIAAGLTAGALLALGISVTLSNASQEVGMTKHEYVMSKLEDWGESAGKTKDQIADAILSGATVARDGTIYLGKEAGKLLNQFGNWLYGEGMVSNTEQSGDMSITFDGVEYPVASELIWSGTQKIVFTTDVAFCRSTTAVNPVTYAFSNQQFTAKIYFWNTSLNDWGDYGQTIISGTPNSGSYYYQNCEAYVGSGNRYGISIPLLPSNVTIKNFLASLDGAWSPSGDALIDGDGFTGDEEEWRAKGDVLLPNDGMNIALNPDLIGSIADSLQDVVNKGVIGVGDYINGVIKAIDGLPIDVPVIDDKTGVITVPGIPAIPDIEDRVAIEDVPDVDIPDIEDREPILDPTLPVMPDSNGVDALGDLTLDLKSVFPFCLPFDAVDMLKLLRAERTTPFYHVDILVPLVNTHMEFDIDLTPFNGVADITRKMELILFCIGLAVSTRHILRS